MKRNKFTKTTLKILSIPLFLISFNASADALSDKITACNAALNKADLSGALAISEEILKLQANQRDGLLCKGRALGAQSPAAQGKYAEALTNLDSALKQSQPGFEQILAHIFIGNLHKNNNKTAEAVASYEASIKICEAEKLNQFKRVNLNLIGDAHAQNKDLNAALSSYTAASKLANNDNERAEDYERLAATYNTLGQHNNAIEYQVKGVLMQRKAGTLDQVANANLELGRIYLAAKEYANAEKTYLEAAKFAKDNGGAYYEARANVGLANTKAANGDAAGAKTLLADAQTQAKNIGAADLNAEIENALKKLPN
jgi:tetratricopeptide (TPR) repeat protein